MIVDARWAGLNIPDTDDLFFYSQQLVEFPQNGQNGMKNKGKKHLVDENRK